MSKSKKQSNISSDSDSDSEQEQKKLAKSESSDSETKSKRRPGRPIGAKTKNRNPLKKLGRPKLSEDSSKRTLRKLIPDLTEQNVQLVIRFIEIYVKTKMLSKPEDLNTNFNLLLLKKIEDQIQDLEKQKLKFMEKPGQESKKD